MTIRRMQRRGDQPVRAPQHAVNASGNRDADAKARVIARSLAKTKQAALELLSDVANRHKPAQVPMVSSDCLTDAAAGEIRWQVNDWTVHLFLEPSRPIEICWGSPDGAIFNIRPTGQRCFARSIDSLRRLGWPKT